MCALRWLLVCTHVSALTRQSEAPLFTVLTWWLVEGASVWVYSSSLSYNGAVCWAGLSTVRAGTWLREDSSFRVLEPAGAVFMAGVVRVPTSSLALHVDMPASLMADRVYQPASDFITFSINKHWRPDPSWYRLQWNNERDCKVTHTGQSVTITESMPGIITWTVESEL